MTVIARGSSDSRAFGGETILRSSLLNDPGVGKTIRDIYEDIDRAFRNMEARTEHPNILWADISGSALTSAGGLLVLKGENFLQGQVFESYAHGSGNAAVTFTAMKPGYFGHSVEIQDTGSVSVAYNSTTKKLTVTIDAGVTTATALATAINAAGSAAKGIIRAVAGGSGAGTPAALAATNFTTGKVRAGYGAGFTCYVSGVEALPYHETGGTPTAPITDTQIRVTVPDLTLETDARGSEDLLLVVAEIDGTRTQEILVRPNSARADEPEVQWMDLTGGNLAAAGGDITLKGAGLLQGQTFDTYTHGASTSQLDFHALKPGNSELTIALVDDGGADVVTKTGNAISVSYDGPGNGDTSTADSIATAINANGADTDGYLRAVSGGAGSVAALAATDLAGGVGSGFTCYVGGQEALPQNETGTSPTAKVSDTQALVTVPDLTASGLAATDIVTIWVVSDGQKSRVNISDLLA